MNAPVNEPLFRSEVIQERQTQWLGTVLLAPRLSHRFFALFAVLAMSAVLILLFAGDYTRKARIAGWLVPQQGLARVFAPQSGIVAELAVKEGQRVLKGETLLVVSTETQSATLGATQASIARRLTNRRDSFADEKDQQQRLLAQQTRALSDRIAVLRSEQRELESEIELQQARVQLKEEAEQRQIKLRDQGFLSAPALQQAQEAKLEQLQRLRTLERNRTTMQRERMGLEAELHEMPLKSQTQLAGLERGMAQLEQELAETESKRELIVTAPTDGTVAALQAERGGRVTANVPLLSIVPNGSVLEAHVFSPSRAVGFVRPGQRVLLRYQAYPYQKFGHYEGTVASVSGSALSPGDLPQQLTGMTNLLGTTEPVYRITIALTSQAVTAYGKPVPLQPGMQLEADVVIEKRALYEWVLEPLYTFSGKLKG